MSTSSPRDRTAHRRAGAVAVLVALAAVAALGGCSSDKPAATATSGTSATTTAPAPPATPVDGGCYALSFAEAAQPTSTAHPVPCSQPHTAATIRVGTFDPVVDGHLLAVDSDAVQQQVASRCRARAAAYLGGDQQTQRLSRLTPIWFTPSLAEADRGALWFRCDVVALAGHDQLSPLPRSVRGILGRPGALDRFGTCGTAAPAGAQFQRVICSRPHSWRARSTIDLPPGAKYLGKAAGAAAEATCHDVEATLATDALKLRWSFEWPTRSQWDQGQRFGYCWTPDPA